MGLQQVIVYVMLPREMLLDRKLLNQKKNGLHDASEVSLVGDSADAAQLLVNMATGSHVSMCSFLQAGTGHLTCTSFTHAHQPIVCPRVAAAGGRPDAQDDHPVQPQAHLVPRSAQVP
jgi:hypothetical protein